MEEKNEERPAQKWGAGKKDKGLIREKRLWRNLKERNEGIPHPKRQKGGVLSLMKRRSRGSMGENCNGKDHHLRGGRKVKREKPHD